MSRPEYDRKTALYFNQGAYVKSRYDNLLKNVDRLALILAELGEEGTKFLTDQARENIIESLVDSFKDNTTYDSLKDLAREGFGGFNNFSDLMLVQEELAHSGGIDDEDWELEICRNISQIEKEVSATINAIITKQLEKDML